MNVFLIYGRDVEYVNDVAIAMHKKGDLLLLESEITEQFLISFPYHPLCRTKWRRPFVRRTLVAMMVAAIRSQSKNIIFASTELCLEKILDEVYNVLNENGAQVFIDYVDTVQDLGVI